MPAEAITGMRKLIKKPMKTYDDYGRGMRIHEKIKLRTEDGIIETTPGRVVFNTIVPKELGFQNYACLRRKWASLIMQCYKKVGLEATVRFLDNLKSLGFAEATKAALSMGVCDVAYPADKAKDSRRSP